MNAPAQIDPRDISFELRSLLDARRARSNRACCASCECYIPSARGAAMGSCRAEPPKLFLLPGPPVSRIQVGQEQGGLMVRSFFPPVGCAEWCRAWKQAAEPDTEAIAELDRIAAALGS